MMRLRLAALFRYRRAMTAFHGDADFFLACRRSPGFTPAISRLMISHRSATTRYRLLLLLFGFDGGEHSAPGFLGGGGRHDAEVNDRQAAADFMRVVSPPAPGRDAEFRLEPGAALVAAR